MREGVVEANPARTVATPKREKQLPSVMQTSEVALLIEQADASTPLGARDRAFLELLYASGLRISELVGIDLDDIELRARLVKVHGKGSKERIVPFGSKAEEASYVAAAKAALKDAKPQKYNGFKIELARRAIVRALTTVGGME